MAEKKQILDAQGMGRAVERMADEALALAGPDTPMALVGVRTHGVTVARLMQESIKARNGVDLPVGVLDITLYRDDLNQPRAAQPVVRPTEIDFDLNDMTVILVDDVLYTGRTIRCALDEIMDFGRPRAVRLAVLVDRGHRELPIQPDITGIVAETQRSQKVEVAFGEPDGVEGVWVHTPDAAS